MKNEKEKREGESEGKEMSAKDELEVEGKTDKERGNEVQGKRDRGRREGGRRRERGKKREGD